MCVDCRGKGVTNDEVRVQEEPVDQANDSDIVQNTCGARQKYAANGYESSSTAESADAGSVIGINDDGSGTNNVETQQNLQREATSKEQIGAGEEDTTGDLPVSEVALDANASEGKSDQGEHAFHCCSQYGARGDGRSRNFLLSAQMHGKEKDIYSALVWILYNWQGKDIHVSC